MFIILHIADDALLCDGDSAISWNSGAFYVFSDMWITEVAHHTKAGLMLEVAQHQICIYMCPTFYSTVCDT